MEEQSGHPCPLCQRLETERTGAERVWALALDALEEGLETATRVEYSKLRLAESDARLDVTMLRLQFDRHRLEHKALRSRQAGR